MTTVDIDARIPNNVDLAGDRRLQRALESWQPKFIEWWRQLGPVAYQDRPVYLRTAIDVGQEGWAQLRPRRDARLPLGHLPGRARAGPPDRVRRPPGRAGVAGRPRRAPRRPAPAGRRPGRHRAGVGRAAAPPVHAPRRACTTCATCSRSTSRRAATCGRWCTCCTATSGATAATRPTRCSSATPATPTSRASSARSTSRRPTGCRSSCSRTSPTATASSSSPRCASRRSTRCRGRATSCSRRRRTTCSSARPASGAWCERTVELMKEHDTDDVRPHGGIDVGDAAALPQLPLQPVARPVRRRDLDERRQLLRRRSEGALPRGESRRRSPAGRSRHGWSLWRPMTASASGRRRSCRRSTRRCATTTSPTAARASTAGTASLAEVGAELSLPHVGFNRAVGTFAGRRVSPDGRLLVRRPSGRRRSTRGSRHGPTATSSSR